MEDARLHVELGLEGRGAVDRVGGGAGRGEGGLGLGEVDEGVVDARLEQVHLGEDHLVVEFFQLAEQRVDQVQGLFVVLVVDVAAKGVGSSVRFRFVSGADEAAGLS